MAIQLNPPVSEWSVCPYCKYKFPARPNKIYCSKGHKKHASALRKEQRLEEESKSVCPTPNKMSFATAEAAEHFITVKRPKFINTKTAYLCPCGWYHNRTDRVRK